MSTGMIARSTATTDRRGFLRAVGLTALAGAGTATALGVSSPSASAAGQTVLSTTYLQQPNTYYCGPTAVSIALSAQVTPPDLGTLGAELGTTPGGTNFGAVSPVLTARIPGATYHDQWMASTTASAADADLLWDRATANVDSGHATVCNWWIMPGAYPNWGGNAHEIYHFVTVDGYDADQRTLRVADPAGTTLSASLPDHHWLPVQDVASYCAGRGYFW